MSDMPKILQEHHLRIKRHAFKTGQTEENNSTLMLVLKGGKVETTKAKFRSLEEKEMFSFWILTQVIDKSVQDIFFVFEGWVKEVPKILGFELEMERIKEFGVRNEPDRKEALWFYHENQNGNTRFWRSSITRESDKRAIIEEPTIFERMEYSGGRFMNFFKQAEDLKKFKEFVENSARPQNN